MSDSLTTEGDHRRRVQEIRKRKARSEDVLNVKECAELLGFSAYSIREFARKGEMPGRKIGGEWRFSRRQLLEWLERNDAAL